MNSICFPVLCVLLGVFVSCSGCGRGAARKNDRYVYTHNKRGDSASEIFAFIEEWDSLGVEDGNWKLVDTVYVGGERMYAWEKID